jgi:hypothetical protein
VSYLARCRGNSIGRHHVGSWENEVEGHANIGGTLCPVRIEEIDSNVSNEREDLVRRACGVYDARLGRRERPKGRADQGDNLRGHRRRRWRGEEVEFSCDASLRCGAGRTWGKRLVQGGEVEGVARNAFVKVVQRFDGFGLLIEEGFQQRLGKRLPRDGGRTTSHMNEHV